MRTERQDVRLVMRLVIAALLAASQIASADCPAGQTPASCALHEEAVALFTAGKYDEAATKFRAAIAAGPTARSYLGYSQCVEEQGKTALAYETMLVAQKLSNEEMAATGGKDEAIAARSERIKYKLAELGAKISYVWLRLPDGVPPRRVVSVYREGEGDLASPFGRWIVVAPTRQVMYATLDDGSRVQVVATVGPGSQGTVVIPVQAAPPVTPPVQPPVGLQPPVGQPIPAEQPAKPTPYPPNWVLGVDAAVVARNADQIGVGLGFAAQYERKLNGRFAITGRAAIVWHGSQETTTGPSETTKTALTEGMGVVGVRTRSKLPLYAAFELGALFATQRTTVSPIGTEGTTDETQHTALMTLLGGGIRFGKFHLEVYAFAVANQGDLDLPVRFFATFGVDLLRR